MPLGRRSQIGCGPLLRVLMAGLGFREPLLHRRASRDCIGERRAQFRFARCQLLCERAPCLDLLSELRLQCGVSIGCSGSLRIPRAPGFVESCASLAQFAFNGRRPFERGVVLRLEIRESRGQRRELRCMVLRCVLLCGFDGGQLLGERRAGADFAAQLRFERGLPVGCSSSVRIPRAPGFVERCASLDRKSVV